MAMRFRFTLPKQFSFVSPRPSLFATVTNPKCVSGLPLPTLALDVNPGQIKKSERGLQFEVGESFFRPESAIGRDLGVLAAALHKKSTGRLRVLDAMCGCGVRSLRYLVQSEADFVWANDANDECRKTILTNLGVEGRFSDEGKRRWVVTHSDARRVLVESYLHREFFDFIDVDSFGSDSSFLRPAFEAVTLGGLVYVTSTDGYSSGGHRPYHSLASYGAYVRPVPYSNEIGLRMLIGGAVRDAAALGYSVSPLFSYYSYHGPVFRVLLRVNRGKLLQKHYGFITYCNKCGNSHGFSWDKLGLICCPCGNREVSKSLVVCGPLWTGPLHDADYVTDMLNLAKQWGWACTGTKGTEDADLEKLLKLIIDESDPQLTFGYIKLDEVASRAKVNSPPLETMIGILRKGGFAACRSHIALNAIKTNCLMTMLVQIAAELQKQ
ncbi:hypothetical protein H6P81_016818 [Aristolochia fimbriata]|uniref:tRNA (guanine(26)-N(2))-dimethyltransferase n=1 Tax=Aristolochia fimbriata TaxID=158543 RepID=A0AAV7E9J4_ARIFI|nr:hypothetical protein H6P81_016818 [Aristolochia fimbriata]